MKLSIAGGGWHFALRLFVELSERYVRGIQCFVEWLALCHHRTHVSPHHPHLAARDAMFRFERPIRSTPRKINFSICSPMSPDTMLTRTSVTRTKKRSQRARRSPTLCLGGMGGEYEVKYCGRWMAFCIAPQMAMGNFVEESRFGSRYKRDSSIDRPWLAMSNSNLNTASRTASCGWCGDTPD